MRPFFVPFDESTPALLSSTGIMKKIIAISLTLFTLGVTAFAQDLTTINPLSVPKIAVSADKPDGFAPAGWKVEETITGDLNGDGKPDSAIKLAQIDASKESGIGGSRVLVIAFNEDGHLKRVAVAAKLLQCVDCGGAFYGVMPAPAGVTIEKGVIVVENEHGSRDVSTSTFRFRYDPKADRITLIGYDYIDRDRLTGNGWNESTNYATNSRITSIYKGKRTTTKRSVIKPTKIYIEDADGDAIEGQALHRLGLD